MDKYSFIAELLEKKHITTSQRRRIHKLVANEIKGDGTQDSDNLKRVENIENLSSKSQKGKLLKDIYEPKPKHVADFMSLFNQRDGLKYLTHDFDEQGEFNINKFLVAAYKIFEEKTGKYKPNKLNIPQSLWRIVKEFAFDSKQTEWRSISKDYKKDISIEIGWASRELRDWSKQNHLHPINNRKYREVINHFKRITRIESSNLEKLINANIDKIFGEEADNFQIEKNDLKKADFYTHVEYLKNALEAILLEIKKYSITPQRKKILIKYKRSISDDGYYLRQIIITHYNSHPTKELKLLLKEWQEKGNMGKIRKKLYGYCHWSIETLIEGTPTRVNILKERNTPEYEIIELKPDGFTHILTFYYK